MSELPEDPNVIGVVTDYTGLRSAIAARRREVGYTQADCDTVIGLSSGHMAKLECGSKHFGAVTLPAVLAALGLRLVILRDPDAVVRPKPSCFSAHAMQEGRAA